MFVGNGGPNLVSSFHVIGEIFDKVRYEGGTHVQENVQTTLIPAGGAVIVEFHDRGTRQLRAGRPLDLPRLQQGCAGDPRRSTVPRTSRSIPGKEVDAVYLGDRSAAEPERRCTEATTSCRRAGTLTLDDQVKAGAGAVLPARVRCATRPTAPGLPECSRRWRSPDYLRRRPEARDRRPAARLDRQGHRERQRITTR